MHISRVRKPQDKLFLSCKLFQENPRAHANRIQRIIQQEGYDFVRSALHSLCYVHESSKELSSILSLLMRPEWIWREAQDTPNLHAFGVEREGEYQLLGYYVTGKNETGEIVTVHRPQYVALKEQGEDPRGAYRPNKIRRKILRQNGRFFVVQAGRVIDLVNAGYPREKVELTEGQGFLSKYPSYVVIGEPHKLYQKAKEALICLIAAILHWR